MKKLLLLVVLLGVSAHAQWIARGSMGLNVVSMSDLRDYLNANYFGSGNQLAQFTSAIEFGGEICYQIKPDYQLGLEFSYEYNSFTETIISTSTFSYASLQPTALWYYTITGSGYQFKFGGGVGPRFILASETSPYTTAVINYKSFGYGVVTKADAMTALGGNFYAYIGVDLRYNNNGTLSDANGNKKINNVTNNPLSLNSVSAGIKVGVAATL